LIFHYAITQQEEDLALIESLVRQYNIQWNSTRGARVAI